MELFNLVNQGKFLRARIESRNRFGILLPNEIEKISRLESRLSSLFNTVRVGAFFGFLSFPFILGLRQPSIVVLKNFSLTYTCGYLFLYSTYLIQMQLLFIGLASEGFSIAEDNELRNTHHEHVKAGLLLFDKHHSSTQSKNEWRLPTDWRK